jgi:hypothetical protein
VRRTCYGRSTRAGHWNYAPYSEVFTTREAAEEYIAKSNRLADENPQAWKHRDWRLLHRDLPCRKWTEAPLSRTA